LGLESDEYITSIRFEFGAVESGFVCETSPVMTVKTSAIIDDGTRIVNTLEVGGKSMDKAVTATDSWVTVALGRQRGELPRTGI
jgi:hypothetical protein